MLWNSIARTIVYSASLALLWCAAGLRMQTSLQAQIVPRLSLAETPYGYIREGLDTPVPSADEAAKLESQLAADPENEQVRGKLLSYYWRHSSLGKQRNDLVYWLVEHHPESPLHQYQRASFVNDSPPINGMVRFSPEDYQRTVQLWQLQVSKHPDDPMVLSNAARVFSAARLDPADEIRLLKRAQELDPRRFSARLADLYQMILTNSGVGLAEKYAALKPQIKSELNSSGNVSLIGEVARKLVTVAALKHYAGGYEAETRQLAIDLTTRAQTLEPGNQEWKNLMMRAEALPVATSGEPPAVAGGAASTIRVGGNVQTAKLLSSQPPVYPPLATQARIQGVVRFNVTIDKEGHISNLTLVSGHPLLVQAAMEAARQYVYQPTLLNGEPVQVITTVEVPFILH
jgi:TonB family C-terminal domain